MGLLDRFEQSMERLLEGASGSIFRQKLQPAEIGKRLERAMLSQQRASVGSRLVPNDFVVRLHPRDYAQFESFREGLSRQLSSSLSQFASRRNFTVLDRITVTLEEDASVRQRQPAVDAQITDQSRPAQHRQPSRQRVDAPRSRPAVPPRPADATAAFEVPSTSYDDSIRLVSEHGESFYIPQGSSTIGRSPDNSIVIDAPDVSRRHARLDREGNHVRIFDLNSTNGTRVNGEAVHISDIEPGDELRLGGQVLKLSGGYAGASGGRW